MRTPYRSLEQFQEKAALLADALALAREEALDVLARISGYEHPSEIARSPTESELLSSREELMARLQAIYPHIENDKAGAAVDQLNLPVRETELSRLAQAPGAAPNISG